MSNLPVEITQLVHEFPEHLGRLSLVLFSIVLGRELGGYPLVCGVFGDLPPTAPRVSFSFYLSGIESLQETTLGNL